jgi:molybdopterin-guanine dinucleotide biosynthesis adapter protein
LNRLHVVGRKNHGKTTLLVSLIKECVRRGLRVGTIKHSAHVHPLDVPGKDSYRQREAGAEPSVLATQNGIGVFLRREPEHDIYARLEPMFAGVDLLLVEGDVQHSGPKIEVWRAYVGGTCLAQDFPSILAVVSDDPVETSVPVWPRSDVATLTGRVLALLAEGRLAVQ